MIFITGANGLLGSYLCPLLEKSGHKLITPRRKEFDITKDTVDKSYLYSDADIIVNLAGYTNVPIALSEWDMALKTNAYSLEWLTKLSNDKQIYHISTDYVYDGLQHNSREIDLLKPFNNYGYSKALGDNILLSSGRSNITIIRTSFKRTPWPFYCAFTDVITNADYVDVIAERICNLILARPATGVYNLGTKSKTMYELAYRTRPDVLKSTLIDFGITSIQPILTMDLTKYYSVTGEKNEK